MTTDMNSLVAVPALYKSNIPHKLLGKTPDVQLMHWTCSNQDSIDVDLCCQSDNCFILDEVLTH